SLLGCSYPHHRVTRVEVPGQLFGQVGVLRQKAGPVDRLAAIHTLHVIGQRLVQAILPSPITVFSCAHGEPLLPFDPRAESVGNYPCSGGRRCLRRASIPRLIKPAAAVGDLSRCWAIRANGHPSRWRRRTASRWSSGNVVNTCTRRSISSC